MCHFLKHILQSCYVKQRHLDVQDRFVTVFWPLQTKCNRILAVTNKCVTVLFLLCNRCMAVTPVFSFWHFFVVKTQNRMINEN